MELKTNYQYTYFIYPFVIKDDKYKEYILKMLKDKNCNLKTREFLFSSFRYENTNITKSENLLKKAKQLSKNPCNIFEYKIENDIQGKIDKTDGIFFTIRKIEIICFKTGICFLTIKTNIDDYTKFSNILNFNYKFKDINNELLELENYDNIRIQTESFSDTKTFQQFVYEITGSSKESNELDIDTQKFLTYSYVCIDQENWNDTNSFDKIEHQFIKYSNLLPADSSRSYEYEKTDIFSKWKYAKIGLSKLGVMLFSSSVDMNNYTLLPEEYENQYFYTWILNLYKKIYLKKLELELKNKNRKSRKEFIEFTKNMWIQEITQDKIGSLLNNKISEVFDIQNLYNQVKDKYDIIYKELNIEKEKKSTIVVLLILMISLVLNIINFIILFKN